jgi:hypothetical protein
LTDKKPVPEPKVILNELLSPSDIIREQQLKQYVATAEEKADKLRQEIYRRKKLDGLKEALENSDFNRLADVFKEIYGTSMIDAGKKLLVSALSLKGYRDEDAIHIEDTVSQWIENTYEETGINGILDWSQQVDTALQIVDEYNVIFESRLAMQNRREEAMKNRREEYRSVFFSSYP